MIQFYTWMDEELPCNDLNDIEKYLMLHQDSGYFTIENSFDANILNWMLDHIDQEAYSTIAVGHFDKPGKYYFDKNNCLKTKADYWPLGWNIENDCWSIFDNN